MSIHTPFHMDHQIFLLVAEKLNISKAAEIMGVGQSGLSKAIRRLENEAGGPLFARRNQGVQLTREGLALLRALKDAEAAWKSSYMNQHQSVEVEGLFTIGGHASVLSVYLPQALTPLLKNYPKLDFEIVTGTSLETTRKVAAMKLDFGVVVNHVKVADLTARRLSVDHIGLWKKKNAQPRWICYSPEMLDIGKLLRKMDRKRLVPIPDYHIIHEMIQLGESEGVLPSTLIKDPAGQLTGKKLRDVEVSLVYHRDNARSPSYQAISGAWKPRAPISAS
jgi:DNA-binding transcriptional LysR family regulator